MPADRPTALVAAPPALTLVESWPRETDLDHPAIPDTAEVWLAMIDGAERTIDLAAFYGATAPGSPLEPILDALARAAARGVRLRGIFDAKFHARDPAVVDRLRALPGAEIRVFDLEARTGGVMHAKYFVVDGDDAFLGSPNLDWRSLVHIQELGLRIREPALVAGLAELFAADWALAGGASIDALRRPRVARSEVHLDYRGQPVTAELVASPHGLLVDESTWDLPRLLAAIDGARARVRLSFLNYARIGHDGQRFDDLDLALRRAAGRGARVELMVADWNLRPGGLDDLRELARVPGVEVRFVTIPPASAGFIPFARVIHAKSIIVDGELAWIGTSNGSGDYFTRSRNVGLLVRGAAFAADVEAVFLDLWQGPHAHRLDPDAAYAPPRVAE